jgi:predicted metal-binding protein
VRVQGFVFELCKRSPAGSVAAKPRGGSGLERDVSTDYTTYKEVHNVKIGIIICDRYRSCGGGKCFRSMRERTGGFAHYSKDEPLEIVGYSSCNGCPGGNVEYVPEEMIKNGAEVIHLATGLVVGYPPCPRKAYFKEYIESRYGIPVVIGTHPIPQKYYSVHKNMPSWAGMKDMEALLATEETRKAYD